MSALDISGSNATALVQSSQTARPAEAIAITALEYGKGRVVVMGDAKWLQPEVLCKGDNGQLFLNIVNWLAKRESAVLPEKMMQEWLDCRFEK